MHTKNEKKHLDVGTKKGHIKEEKGLTKKRLEDIEDNRIIYYLFIIKIDSNFNNITNL